MRIVKVEQIYLSQNEADTWTNFEQILEGLDKGCENPDTVNLVNKIQSYLDDLYEKVVEVE